SISALRPANRQSQITLVRASKGENMKPHRGTLILILGILSLVCCGLFTGIPAWIMGGGDLKEMRAGRMDPSGETLTKVGWILGIVGTVLSAVGIVIQLILLAAGGGLALTGK